MFDLYALQNCSSKSDFIKTYRKMSDMTQETFAQKCGVSLATIKNWENERSSPRTVDYHNIFTEKDILELFQKEPWFKSIKVEVRQHYAPGIISMARSFIQCFPSLDEWGSCWTDSANEYVKNRHELHKPEIDLCKKIMCGLLKEISFAKDKYDIYLTADELVLLKSILIHSLRFGAHLVPSTKYTGTLPEDVNVVLNDRCQIVYAVLHLSRQLAFHLEMSASDVEFWSGKEHNIDISGLISDYDITVLTEDEYYFKYYASHTTPKEDNIDENQICTD